MRRLIGGGFGLGVAVCLLSGCLLCCGEVVQATGWHGLRGGAECVRLGARVGRARRFVRASYWFS